MKAILVAVLIFVCVPAFACEEDAQFVVSVITDVGPIDAATGGGYAEASWDALGEELDDRDYLDDATVIMVNWIFKYNFVIGGHTGVLNNICLHRDPDETWKDVTHEFVESDEDEEDDYSEDEEENEDAAANDDDEYYDDDDWDDWDDDDGCDECYAQFDGDEDGDLDDEEYEFEEEL